MTRRVPILLAVLALSACQAEAPPAPEMSNAERGQIQAEVLDWADAWLAATTGLDAQAASALLDAADAHLMTEGGYLANRQMVIDAMTEDFLSVAHWESEWTMRRVDVLGQDAALFVGQTSGTVRMADGEEKPEASAFGFVLRRVDGSWKALYGQHGSVPQDPPS